MDAMILRLPENWLWVAKFALPISIKKDMHG
jgi:hypothetical protein